MTDKEFWDLAYITVCGIQFHPRNNTAGSKELVSAAKIADEMLKERQCRENRT